LVVCERAARFRVVVYGSLPVAAFVLPLSSGSGLVAALKFAGLQAGIIGVSVLIVVAIRSAGISNRDCGSTLATTRHESLL
jgi:hypothetical protein